MLIAVKNRKDEVFTNDMSEGNPNVILEIHFCTSYTQVIVQREGADEEGNTVYTTEDIIIPIENPNKLEQALDFIAVNESELGEWCELVEA